MVEEGQIFAPVTVAEFIEFSEIQGALPEIYATPEALSKHIVWAHVLSAPSSISLLDGGELVMTTGAGWPTTSSEVGAVAKDLIKANAAAIVLELGQNFTETPQELLAECKANDTALIVLHKEVRFVQLTQRLHRMILAAQNDALEARASVHRMLTELGLNKSPVDYMIEQMAATLGAPVVLENLTGHVVAWSAPAAATSPTEVLKPWIDAKGKTTINELVTRGKYVRVGVEARGTRWGTLTALEGPSHPAGRKTILELGAFALALGRLSDPDGDSWARLSSKKLIDDLLGGRYRNDIEMASQLSAVGLPIQSRALTALTLTGIGNFNSHLSLEKATLETALRRAIAPEGQAIISENPDWGKQGAEGKELSLLALVSLPADDERTGNTPSEIPRIAVAINRELEMLVPKTVSKNWHAHLSLGMWGDRVQSLIASLEGVQSAGLLEESARHGLVTMQLASKQPLSYLLRTFQGSPALQKYVKDVLDPLLRYDTQTGPGFHGDLLEILSAYLETPTNRSLAAAKANLSRSVFYQRLDLIEDLLDVDLADGMTIAALTVALTAHRL